MSRVDSSAQACPCKPALQSPQNWSTARRMLKRGWMNAGGALSGAVCELLVHDLLHRFFLHAWSQRCMRTWRQQLVQVGVMMREQLFKLAQHVHGRTGEVLKPVAAPVQHQGRQDLHELEV